MGSLRIKLTQKAMNGCNVPFEHSSLQRREMKACKETALGSSDTICHVQPITLLCNLHTSIKSL